MLEGVAKFDILGFGGSDARISEFDAIGMDSLDGWIFGEGSLLCTGLGTFWGA